MQEPVNPQTEDQAPTRRMFESNNAIPIITYSMFGEMINCLQQRLQAYSNPDEQQVRIIGDLIHEMYSESSGTELELTLSELSCNLKPLLQHIANSSVMRLAPASMDSLYRLIHVVFKRQALLCNSPRQLLQLTLTHMESAHTLARSDTKSLVRAAVDAVIAQYGVCTEGQWLLLQQEVLKFLQDCKTRAKVLCQDGLQDEVGRIKLRNTGQLPLGAELPGEIRYYSGGALSCAERFPVRVKLYRCSLARTVMEPDWNVGCSVYTSAGVAPEAQPGRPLRALPESMRRAEAALVRAAIEAGYDPARQQQQRHRLQPPRPSQPREATAATQPALNLSSPEL